jgi:BMFP domain-containing protein YqiC
VSSRELEIRAELALLKARLAALEAQLGQNAEPLPVPMGSSAARLIALARQDPEAAKAEALRLAKEDTLKRRIGRCANG